MAYTNSAGVKLNNNADIIIEADAAGNVTSCRNAITGTEYAGGAGTAECIVSNTGSAAIIPIMAENGYYTRSVNRGQQNLHLTVPIINGGLRVGTGYEEDIINYSGDISFDGEYYMITGDCTFTFNYE